MNLPLTLVAGHGRLVGRPTGVAHIYVGPMTPSGRLVPRAGRTACRARTRRLYLLQLTGPVLDPAGRRMCASCLTRLRRAAGRADEQLHTRDQFLSAYRHLQACHLAYATALATTVEETHGLAFIAQMVLGPAGGSPLDPASWTSLDASIIARRRAIVAATHTPEEIEAARRAREIQAYNDALARAARRQAERIEEIHERQRRGSYVPSWDKALAAH